MDLTVSTIAMLSEMGWLRPTEEFPVIPLPDFILPLEYLPDYMDHERELLENGKLYETVVKMFICDYFTKYHWSLLVFGIWFYGLTDCWCQVDFNDYAHLGPNQFMTLIHSNSYSVYYWYKMIALPEQWYSHAHDFMRLWWFDNPEGIRQCFTVIGKGTCVLFGFFFAHSILEAMGFLTGEERLMLF